MIYPNEQDYLKLAENHDLVPVFKEILADTETPVSVLQRFVNKQNAFLFESMEGGETWGRYSFIGIDPQIVLEVDHAQPGTEKIEQLRKIYQGLRVAELPGLPRFFGGAVGFLAYEAIGEFERMPEPKQTVCNEAAPVSRFLQADRLIVFDNKRHTVKLVICTRPRDCETPSGVYRKAVSELEELAEQMHVPAPVPAALDHRMAQFASNIDRDTYEAMVMRAKNYIVDGDIIQVVLSQRFSADCDVTPLQLYRALRLLNPSPYTFFLKTGGHCLVGSSPEVMVRLSGDKIEVRPIAGTRPRGGTEQEDRALADELLADEKERAEHVMLVDLGRNDIGRVAEAGSVQVTEFMVIERYSHVMHMVSHVQGILKSGCDAMDVLRATFPAGTLSGAPKIRAMEIIHELEPGPRGAYGGAVGYISYSGNMDFAITIRTLEVTGNRVAVQAGAGVVYDSVPAREYEETCHKARAMQHAVELACRGLDLDLESGGML